jgi:hypothetical protein
MFNGHVMILFGLPIVGIDSGFVRITARFDDRGRSLPTKRIKRQVLRLGMKSVIIIESMVENHRIADHII